MTRTESPAEDLFLAGFVEAFARRHDRQDLHVHRGNVSLVHPCSLVGGPNPDVPAACVEDLRLDHEMSAAWIGLAWRKEQRPFALFSQVKAEESRLDFLLALSGYSPTNPFPTFVAVEIDGWTYHGRDDEQAIARDHLRDVALLTSFGVPTVRLMASMLRAQPAECGDLALAALIEDHIKRSMMIDAAITIHENTQRSLARRALVDAARSGVATAAQMEAGC